MHQVVEGLQTLLESEPELFNQANEMFEQETSGKNVDVAPPPPPGRPQVNNYRDFLEALDDLMVRAPEYHDENLGLIGLPFSTIINWPLGTKSGVKLLANSSVNDQFRQILNQWTMFLSSKASSYVLNDSPTGWFCRPAMEFMMGLGENSRGEFEKVFVCDPGQEHWGYRSFDDFFTRKLRAGARPVASPMDWSIITHPCDACPYQLDTSVRARDSCWIKGRCYSLRQLLAGHSFTDAFIGGTIYQGFLKSGGYHRWHCPVDGYIRDMHHVPGTIFSRPQNDDFKPSEPTRSQKFVAQTSTRVLIFIQADNPEIGLMCVMLVGWAEVSTCEVTVRTGQRVVKGEQLGVFHYGGSTHCLLFRPGVELEFDLHGQGLGRQAGVVPVNSKIARVVTREVGIVVTILNPIAE
ncbi:MAG: hypothetical protein L6R40_008038 [Gallowayella cf. fulva]|nr:MAG: hypothetical protein L6R40_008038 [Xanthomendoza cf. fulva]